MPPPLIVLGIESSCDETAAAVLVDGRLRSNVVAGQEVHAQWGGVVPELASRAHQEHIVPVVDTALRQAGVDRRELSAVNKPNASSTGCLSKGRVRPSFLLA